LSALVDGKKDFLIKKGFYKKLAAGTPRSRVPAGRCTTLLKD
jgi:hypothetical protein